MSSYDPLDTARKRRREPRGQGDLFSAPLSSNLPFQRHSATSKASAKLAAPRAPTQRQRVLEAIRASGHDGMTDAEVQEALHMNPSTQRPRRVELENVRQVVKTQRTRNTPSGRKAAIYVTPENAA